MRRSPAGAGKPAPPLPLDLHVLSLSLAFILSQDQTLRCCYLVFLSFKRWSSRTPDNPPEQRHPARDVPLFYLWLEYDRELLFASPVARRAAPVLLFLSYCKPFNVLFPGGSSEPAKNVAKLQTCFELRKFFNRFFSPAFRRPLPGTFRHRGGTSVPESECKGRHFFITLQIFQQKNFTKIAFFSVLKENRI